MGQGIEDFPDDRSGCGLARVAELTGRSYGEVRDVYLRCGGDAWMLKAAGGGLFTDEVMRVGRELGVCLPVVEARGPCIILVRDKSGFGHYVGVTHEGQLLGAAELIERGIMPRRGEADAESP